MKKPYLLFLSIVLLIVSCSKKSENITVEKVVMPVQTVISLEGKELFPRNFSTARQNSLDSNLNIALNNYKSDSLNEMNIIWYGRRLAYMDKYQEAISIYSKGLEQFPESYKILRHRGHRYISSRKLDYAIEDFSRAATLSEGTAPEIEPDGMPNQLNQPLTTTQWNIYYHLGLAYYLNGDFDNAIKAYLTCYDLSDNDDVLVAITDWLYMAYRRNGEPEKAEALLSNVHSDMVMIENDSYLKRIMMYKREVPADSILIIDKMSDDYALSLATQGYGVGNWYLYNGDTTRAKEIFNEVLTGDYWPAFGYIAAEADMARLK